MTLDCTVGLVALAVTSSFLLSVVGTNLTYDNTLFDPRIVVLSLNFLCVRFWVFYSPPRLTMYFPNMRVVF